MLQRIQTVFMAIAAIALLAFLGLPIWSKNSTATHESASLNALQLVHTKGTLSEVTPVYYLAVMAILGAILAIYSIFQYKNRVKQMVFVALNSLICGALLAVCVYVGQFQIAPLFNSSDKGTYQFGFWAAAIALFCNWAAGRFIRRDEKMVKNADRMR